MIHKITSPQNQNLKNTAKLREKRDRQKTNLFLVEGVREIERALSCSYILKELYLCPTLMLSHTQLLFDRIDKEKVRLFEVDEICFSKIAVRESTEGMLAVFEQKQFSLNELKLHEELCLLAVENIEKPGNLGAILRSADGAKIDAVVVLENTVDVFNPNVIRSSLGTVFSVPVIHLSNQEFYDFLIKNHIASYAAALNPRSQQYTVFDYKKKSTFILGTESTGLSDFWLQKSDHLIVIPMLGIADSLNVSVAASVLAYESLRQRQL